MRETTSVYRKIFDYNRSLYLLSPMILASNHNEKIKTLTDCFLGKDKNSIVLYCKLGRNNRMLSFHEVIFLKSIPGLIDIKEDEVNDDYLLFRYEIPSKWRNDFNLIVSGRCENISQEYFKKIISTHQHFFENNKDMVSYIYDHTICDELYQKDYFERVKKSKKFIDEIF